MQHGAAEGDRGFDATGLEGKHRNQADSVRLRRHEHALDHRRRVGGAEDAGNRVAVDVGIEQSDRQALACKGHSEVRGDRGLAHTALTGCNREDLGRGSRLGEGDLLLVASAQQLLQLGALIVVHDIEVDIHFRDVRNLHDRIDNPVGDGRAHRAPLDRQIDTDLDHPALADVDALEHADLGDRSINLWVVDGCERRVNRIGIGLVGHAPMLLAAYESGESSRAGSSLTLVATSIRSRRSTIISKVSRNSLRTKSRVASSPREVRRDATSRAR